MKNIIIAFLSIVFSASSCLALEVDLPPELSSAINIDISNTNDPGGPSFKLKAGGKWVMSADEIEKIIPTAKWIVFDFGGKRMPHVLQVRNGSAIIFSETLTLRYRIHIPLSLLLSNGLPEKNQIGSK